MKNDSKSTTQYREEIRKLKTQLAQKKKQLTETQRSMNAAIDSLDDMLFYKDLNSIYLGCNKAVTDFFNLNYEDIVGKSDHDLFPPKIAARHKNDDKMIIDQGIDIGYESWMTNAKGHKLLIEVHKSPMKDKKGKTIGIIGISRDISKRYMNEEKLKILQFGIDKSKIGICQISENGKIQYANDFLCEQSGYTHEELLKLTISDIDATMNLSAWKKNREKIKAGFSNTFESIQINKDGTRVPVEITVNYFNYNNELISFSFAKYIAEQKAMREQLYESEKRFRTLVEQSTDGMILADLDGQIIEVNKQTCKSLGYSVKELMDLKLGDIDSNFAKSKEIKKLKEQITPGKPLIIESNHKREDGTIFPVEVSIGLIELRGKSVLLGFARDITERIESQKALLESEEHLRTTLNSIGDAVFSLNVSEQITDMNPMAEKLCGCSIEQVKMQKLSKVLQIINSQSGKRIRNLSRDVLKYQKRVNIDKDIALISKNGEKYQIAESGAPILDAEGKITGVVLVIRDITKEHQVLDALHNSQKNLELAQDIAHMGSWDLNLSTGYGYWSKEMFNLFQRDPDQGIPSFDEFLDYVHPDDRQKLKEANQNAITKRQSFNAEIRTNPKYGPMRVINAQFECKLDKQKKVVILFGTCMDITTEQKMRQALIDSEKKYRTLFDSMTQGVVYHDADGMIISANPAAQKILGLSLDQLMGRTSMDPRWRSIREDGSEYPGEEHPAMQALITGKPVKDILMGIFVPESEEYRWILVSAMPEFRKGENKPYRVFATFADITKIKKVEDLIKQNTELLQESQRVARLGHYVLDITLGLWQSSPMLDKIFGIDENFDRSINGWIKLIHPDFKQEMGVYLQEYIIEQGNRFDKEYKIIRSDDKKERWVHGIGRLEFNEKGNAQRMIGTIQDIHDRKLLEEQLIQSQKMEAIGQLAGGVAHDFNNMLTVINGYSEMLLNKDIPSEYYNPIKEIQNASIRATRLTSQLLAFSRKQIIQPKMLNLNALIREQIKMLRRLLGEDVEISTVLDPQLNPVKADIGQIEQIIMNISINARDAMPLGGKLTIETSNVVFDNLYAKAHPEVKGGTYSMLAISDTGVGMDDVIRSRIFEPFYTTKGRDKGTGLGLATVYGIVKQNNGFIYVYSEIQKGSTFKIYLPSSLEKSRDHHLSVTDENKLKGSGAILLVEDDDGVRSVTRSALEKYGYEVVTASNGEEALRVYETHGGKFDLVLTDVIMPLMSGRELADKLREKDSKIKILYFSGYTDNSIVHHGVLDEGMQFIQKPYSHTELARKVRSVINS